MTIAELERAVKSWRRVEQQRAKETATHNYISALLIGKSVASYFSEEITMPPIEEIYPTLFTDNSKQVEKQNKQQELYALRFRQFANSYNKRFDDKEANC